MAKKEIAFVFSLVLMSFASSAEGGDFNSYFSPTGRISLRDPTVKFAFPIAADVSASGRIAVVACTGFSKTGVYRNCGLKVYAADGSLQRHLTLEELAKMAEPWSERRLAWLYDVAYDRKGQLFVTSARHILIFDSMGVFQRGFNLSNVGKITLENLQEVQRKGWAANILRLDVGPNGEIAGAGDGVPKPYYLHTYGQNGGLLKEFFLLDSSYYYKNNYSEFLSLGYGMDVDSLGDIWCIFEPLYKVFHYGMNGTPKGEIVGKSAVYRPANFPMPTSQKQWQRWIKSWTPVVNCGVTQSGYVLLVMLANEQGKPYMKDYDPDGDYMEGGFFIDIYDREGNLIAGGLHTPHRFLCVDPQDNIWFDLRPDTPENPGPPLSKGRSKPDREPPAVLGKYRLTLKPVMAKDGTAKTGK